MCIFKYVDGNYYSSPQDLFNLISYVVQAHGRFTAVNGQGIFKYSSCEDITKNFICTKSLYNKLNGRWAYHYIISPGPVFSREKELTIEDMMQIGRYISETFFYGFQTVYAVHTNTDNLHIHLVVNSVSYIDGRKLRFQKGFLYEARQEIERYIYKLVKHKDYTCKNMCEFIRGICLLNNSIN